MENRSNLLDRVLKKVRRLPAPQLEELYDILDSWDQGEHREYQRLKTRTPVDVVVDDRYFQAVSQDISAGGVLIKAAGNFEPHSEVRLVFSFPGQDKPFKLAGKIVRVQESGIAIEFDKISPYFKKILDEAIWDQDVAEK